MVEQQHNGSMCNDSRKEACNSDGAVVAVAERRVSVKDDGSTQDEGCNRSEQVAGGDKWCGVLRGGDEQ
jgi:hypothetical protein